MVQLLKASPAALPPPASLPTATHRVGGEGFAVYASLILVDANRQTGAPGSEGLPPNIDNRAVYEQLAVLEDTAFGAATPVVTETWRWRILRRAVPVHIAGRPFAPNRPTSSVHSRHSSLNIAGMI